MVRIINYRPIKFILTGGSAAFLEYASFVMIREMTHWSVAVAQIISFIIGFVVSFLLNRQWVFSDSAKKHWQEQILAYSLLAIVNIGLTATLMVFVVDNLGISQWFAKFVMMAMVAVWNYFIFKKVIFK